MDISALRERPTKEAFTVFELNNYIKNLIDSNRLLAAVSVTGEISNFTDHRSGHLYFSLKDSDAQIKAVMFRSQRAKLKFMPVDGMRVTVFGSVSVYSQTGTVQLYVNSIEPDGVGALYKAYEQLKAKLSEEGLFSEEYKKALPQFPEKIGVITSPTGAAVRDIINVTGRRYPLAEVYLYPSLVQGDGAEESLIRALDYLDKSKLCDVIIIGRGGGSIEDLWAFNSERLARRIFEAETPIISAVGHETDFTICDFVADLRAPTPSAAAELSVPDIRELTLSLDDKNDRLISALLRIAERKREKLSRISEKEIFSDPSYLFEDKKHAVEAEYERLVSAIREKILSLSADFRILAGKANAMSPLSVLARGYSVAERGGKVLRSVKELSSGDEISLTFADGKADLRVEKIKN